MVVIVWYLDLYLPVQSVSITTEVVSSNNAHGFFLKNNILIPNVAEKNILVLVEENK